ncbi:hypothetical protein ABZ714_22760 [Streptomyces sp. NPDC006798]|uniref:hypothetical protein n=1 Tax=Streptomyces sp. NPDC006798 TaxID=3155462 RepID=UPI0033F6B6B5
MGKFTYTDLMELDLGRLAAAVSDWKTVVTKLTELTGDSRDGLLKKSEDARWQGVNASVTRDFVRKTAKEIGDLSLQARSIHAVLGDAHSELTRIQKRARELTAEAKAGNPDRRNAEPDIGLLVSDGGNGTVVVTESVCDAEGPSTRTEDLKRYYADALTSLVSHAAEVDAATVRALKASHGGDPHNAGHVRYSSLDEDQLPRAMRLAALGDKANPGQRAELGRLWDSLSPDARAELWGRHRTDLLAAGLLDPRSKQVAPDRGMGSHGIADAGWSERVTNQKMLLLADGADLLDRPDAARHFRHYLGNSGDDLKLPVDKMLRDDPRLLETVQTDVGAHGKGWRKQALEEFRENGGKPVSIRVESEPKGFSFDKDENPNWFYAVGSTQFNATGVVTVAPDAEGRPVVDLEYQVNVWDRYNWDEGKGVNIKGLEIPDGEMGRQHTVGLAREFDMAGSGSVQRHSLGGVTPGGEPLPPPPTDPERAGERSDSGRKDTP